MHVRNALAAAIVAAVAFAGCGGGDDDPAAPEPDESSAPEPGEPAGGAGADGGGDDDGTGDQGAAAASGSDRPDSVREEFPVPFPAGWEIDIQGEIGLTETSGAQLLYPNDEYDAIVAFYDDWFESQPDEFARSVVGEQVIYQQLGDTLYQVSVTPDHEERDVTWVLLQVFGGAVN